MLKIFTKVIAVLFVLSISMMACEGPEGPAGPAGAQGAKGDQGDKGDQGEPAPGPPSEIDLKPHSLTPSLLKAQSGFENIEVMPLISSEDQLEETPNFTYGGSADGIGLLATSQGYSMLVNHEDNFAVSRVELDKSFRPIRGEYILNSSGGLYRLCSATLATPEEHGFGPVYLTCGESNIESRTHGVNPYSSEGGAGFAKTLNALGRWNAEQALPLPISAYSNRTVILIGDDDSGSTGGGQVVMYLTDPNKVGDLSGGKVYVLRTVDQNSREMDLVEGSPVDIEFVQVTVCDPCSGSIVYKSGADLDAEAASLNSIAFGRVEDLDYRKGGGANGREIYFNVTGQSGNSDRSRQGRTYKLVLDEGDPLNGTLELVLDGDKPGGKADAFQNPDNILVTENYVYIQEDPNGYGDETHDAFIYQYNLSTGELKVVFELNHYRDDSVLGEKFKSSTSSFGSWEYGGFIDISSTISVNDVFLLNVQPHTWRDDRFRNPDGGSIRVNENQASQTLIIKGLPR